MYYASFYPYGCNIANVFDSLAFETKQERDNWLTKNEYDYEGSLQAEKLCDPHRVHQPLQQPHGPLHQHHADHQIGNIQIAEAALQLVVPSHSFSSQNLFYCCLSHSAAVWGFRGPS